MAAAPPSVRLGAMADNGIAPSVFVLVERGVERRPDVARSLAGRVLELRFEEGFAPVRIAFERDAVLVEDVVPPAERAPDAVIAGPLPPLIRLAAAPSVAGVPKLTSAAGRAALGSVASGRVRISGRRGVARRVLRLLQIETGSV